MSAVLVLMSVVAATIAVPAAQGCDAVPATARLGRGVCALESLPDGVRAQGCARGSWTIPATTIATAASPGAAADALRGAPLRGIRQGQAVDVQVSDGKSLWMGVSERIGCTLRPRGLVRYDLRRGAAHAFRGTDAGPCGFLVQDLLLRDQTLWVATDLGVSRLRVSPDDWDEWTHFTASGDGGLEETACASVLAVVAQAAVAGDDQALARLLAEFRPKFARRHGMRNASTARRRRNEEALGHAGRAGTGRGRPLGAPLGGPGRARGSERR